MKNRKGFGESKILLTIFVVAVGMLLLSFVTLRIGEPTMVTHSDESANLNAYLAASAINALSVHEEGRVEIAFKGLWNVAVYETEGKKMLMVSYHDERTDKTVAGSAVVMGNVDTTDTKYSVSRLAFEKKRGEAVTVTKTL